MNNLLPLPVLLPLLGAGLTLALNRRPRAQRLVATLALAGVTTIAALLVWLTDAHGPLVLWVGNWPQPLGIALVAAVAAHKPGDKVTLTVHRGSRTLKLDATLGTQPTRATPQSP